MSSIQISEAAIRALNDITTMSKRQRQSDGYYQRLLAFLDATCDQDPTEVLHVIEYHNSAFPGRDPDPEVEMHKNLLPPGLDDHTPFAGQEGNSWWWDPLYEAMADANKEGGLTDGEVIELLRKRAGDYGSPAANAFMKAIS